MVPVTIQVPEGTPKETVRVDVGKGNLVAAASTTADLQGEIIYKAQVYRNIVPVGVEPRYSSKTCPIWGQVNPENRPNNVEQFVCQDCGRRQHADLVGAIDIALKELVKDQGSEIKRVACQQA